MPCLALLQLGPGRLGRTVSILLAALRELRVGDFGPRKERRKDGWMDGRTAAVLLGLAANSLQTLPRRCEESSNNTSANTLVFLIRRLWTYWMATLLPPSTTTSQPASQPASRQQSSTSQLSRRPNRSSSAPTLPCPRTIPTGHICHPALSFSNQSRLPKPLAASSHSSLPVAFIKRASGCCTHARTQAAP
ncbi:hypothetical protein IWX46DRAFT_359018 [Phyllosticta citricarpa]|uniref:Uncharacterized protein n=1 Tax=Phyllosticta citricarpa TaxID=55181 RepID=A0ABR1LBQ9_9PEZI